MSGVRVREMALADCDRVSEIRVRGWQAAYKGLMPQSYLDALSTERDAARRRARFGQRGGAVVNLVAERAGEVVGWACHGPYRDGEVRATDVELYAIYVDPDRTGAGVGRALLREAAERCAAAGYERMLLWVLKENRGRAGSTSTPDSAPTAPRNRSRRAASRCPRSATSARSPTPRRPLPLLLRLLAPVPA